MSIFIRRLLAGLIVGLIIFTGFVPMMPHDDFGDGAQAHDIMAEATAPIDSSGDNSLNEDGYPDVHCFGIAHFFMISVPVLHGFSVGNSNFDPFENNLPLSQIVTPSSPPPNV